MPLTDSTQTDTRPQWIKAAMYLGLLVVVFGAAFGVRHIVHANMRPEELSPPLSSQKVSLVRMIIDLFAYPYYPLEISGPAIGLLVVIVIAVLRALTAGVSNFWYTRTDRTHGPFGAALRDTDWRRSPW